MRDVQESACGVVGMRRKSLERTPLLISAGFVITKLRRCNFTVGIIDIL